MDTFKPILECFEPVSLEEIDQVKLMNRIDRKYWFNIEKLELLLQKSLPFYNILEIEGQRLMEYQTTYLDTPDNSMYLKHHNKKLNRYKVRRRNYTATESAFFEIKFKTNQKRTLKQRIKSDFQFASVLEPESGFLIENTPFEGAELQPCLSNRFYRITLIHKAQKDRCTIDLRPKFWNDTNEIQFDDLVIFELKRGKSLKSSPMLSLLRELKIRQRGLSKYCTGRAMLEPGLKRNAFKPRLRYLEKNILTESK